MQLLLQVVGVQADLYLNLSPVKFLCLEHSVYMKGSLKSSYPSFSCILKEGHIMVSQCQISTEQFTSFILVYGTPHSGNEKQNNVEQSGNGEEYPFT